MRDGDDARGASRPAAPGQPPGFSERSQLRGGARRGPPITPTNTHPGGTKGGAGARHQRAEGLWDASSPPKLSTSQGADFWRCLCYRGWVTALPAGSPSCCDTGLCSPLSPPGRSWRCPGSSGADRLAGGQGALLQKTWQQPVPLHLVALAMFPKQREQPEYKLKQRKREARACWVR